MNRKYFLAADGGGSKVQAVLYDNEFNIIRTGKMSGTNTMFKPEESVNAEMDEMLDEILKDIPKLHSVDFCIVGPDTHFKEALAKRCEIGEINRYSEPHMGVAAAFSESGITAVSGTGSDAFIVDNGTILTFVGGWGPLFGDEGSGYDIGLRSIKAVLNECDGRRPPTLMTEMVKEKFGITNLWEIIHRMNRNPNARHEIASVATVTSKAAMMGDKVALDIYNHAAHELALQVIAAIHKVDGKWNGPIVTMGGAWKGCPLMFERFKHEVHGVFPDAEIIRPEYDPVVGCVILRARKDGLTMDEIGQRLKGKFDYYLYSKGEPS